MNADGAGLMRLTDNPATDYAPSWSPDGRRIAFHSSRDGHSEIYVMNSDGTGVAKLTQYPAGGIVPKWASRFRR